jgi:hypothetical protein
MPDAMQTLHVWEKHEITFQAAKTYANPYTEVEAWVDLEGPGFHKRCYGFWDGGNIFRVRVVATEPGQWRWVSGSNQADSGLNGLRGSFNADPWNEAAKAANVCRRGFLRPTANGHALECADGAPFFLLGDTWWATSTFRYPWYEDDEARPIGPEMGFKEMVRYRQAQGYNCIAILAAFPNWANDGAPAQLRVANDEQTPLRAAWLHPGGASAKDMHNPGGRPFLFPGKVPGYEEIFPDVDRINPAYFQHMDLKIDYLNQQGFIPFIEVARRDAIAAWKKYYAWPDSYARYIQYVFSRYQANNCILSPIHFDWMGMTIPSREYNEPANLVIDRYGPPPFGTLLSANASPSTLVNFGGPEEARWLTLDQIGNWREHDNYWYLTEIFRAPNHRPGLNGEPYYPGFPNDEPPAPSEEANFNARSGMYGSVLSGGLAGHIYGVQGIWGGDIEPEARYRMWEALQFKSGDQMRHLRTFVLSEGQRYQALVPTQDAASPNKSGPPKGYKGWAYCARTDRRDFFLLYFERECPQATVRGAIPFQSYRARWFDPQQGEWHDVGNGALTADAVGQIVLPPFPNEDDWGLSLVLASES